MMYPFTEPCNRAKQKGLIRETDVIFCIVLIHLQILTSKRHFYCFRMLLIKI